jgi:cytochrome c oxidase subunit 2
VRHFVRIGAIWLVVSIIVELLIAIVPIPSPVGSREGQGAHQTIYMLFYVGAPIFVFVWTLFLYNVIVFRHRPGEAAEPAVAPDSTPILLLWAGISFVVVLFMAGWGTFTLKEITQAPQAPVVQAASKSHGQTTVASIGQTTRPLDIQVIGQEWFWTFRYPTYGGMETRDLYVPVNTPVHFHVTSLDVVHSFWVYDYDIKEDAVPGVSNDAYLLARDLGGFTNDGKNWVKCNELCGIWHGYMKTGFYVVTPSAFKAWATKQEQFEKSIGLLKVLPAYSPVYYPAANSNWPPAPQDQSP